MSWLTELLSAKFLGSDIFQGVVAAGTLVATGPSGAPPSGLRAFEVVDVDPNIPPGLVRPAGSIVLLRNGFEGWLKIGGSGYNWLAFGDLSSFVGQGEAINAIVHAQTGYYAHKVYTKRLTYNDFKAAGSGAIVTVNAIPPWGTEMDFQAWTSARLTLITTFAGTGISAASMIVGSQGHADNAFCKMLDVFSATGSPGDMSDEGADDPEAQSLTVQIKLSLGGGVVANLTQGEVLLHAFFR